MVQQRKLGSVQPEDEEEEEEEEEEAATGKAKAPEAMTFHQYGEARGLSIPVCIRRVWHTVIIIQACHRCPCRTYTVPVLSKTYLLDDFCWCTLSDSMHTVPGTYSLAEYIIYTVLL